MGESLFSVEAEQALIGGLFVSPVKFDDVALRVSESEFHDSKHRWTFQAMAELNAQRKEIDLVTVAEQLEARGRLAEVEWAYLGILANETPSAANVLAYADLVRSRARRRRLMRLGTELQQWAQHASAEVTLEKLATAIAAISLGAPESAQLMKDFLPGLIERMDKLHLGEPVHAPALPTGLRDLDATLNGGIRAGQLFVIAGRPAMGKSVLGLQIASHISRKEDMNALLFSLEMTGAALTERELAARGDIALDAIRTGKLDEDEWARLTTASAKIAETQVWIDETPGLSLQALQARARRMHRQSPLGLVVVDHIGLMGVEGRYENRQQAVAMIARELKGLAKELQCPVIALSQLNRELEHRQNKRPMLADLRESGEVEQSADVICFIYRDEVYNPDSPDKGCAELIIGKHRDGKTGMVSVAFRGEHSKFTDLSGPLPSSSIPKTVYKRGIDF